MRAVVTGATGLLGGNLCAHLVDRGSEVHAVRRNPSRGRHLEYLGCHWHDCDLADQDLLTKIFDGVDAVFHCAGSTAQSSWLRADHLEDNINATRNVIIAARRARVGRLVHCSTTVTCGFATTDRDVDETCSSSHPADGYVRSKCEAEDIVRAAAARGLDAVIVNPGFMLGPLDARPSSGQLILNVARQRIPGVSSGVNNFVDARAVAAGLVQAFERGVRGQRYILGGDNLSYREVIGEIADVVGVPRPQRSFPEALAHIGGRVGDAVELVSGRRMPVNSATMRYAYCKGLRYSSARAKAELGYSPTSLRKAIVDAVAWFRSAGMLAAASAAGFRGSP